MIEDIAVYDFPGAPRVTIREATADDVEAVSEMGRRFLHGSSYDGWLWDNPTARERHIYFLLTSDDGKIWLLLDPEGGIVGMLGAYIFRHPFSDQTIASELFWWVDPVRKGHGIRLLKAFERWACDRAVDLVQMSDPAGNDLQPLYQRLGYTLIERNYWRSMS